MKRNFFIEKKKFWPLLLILLLAMAYFYSRRFREEPLTPELRQKLFQLAAVEIQAAWIEGKSGKGCSQSARACHAPTLNCWLKEKGFTYQIKNQSYQLEVIRQFPWPSQSKKQYLTVVTRNLWEGDYLPRYGVLLSLKIKDDIDLFQDLLLEGMCDYLYLPQRVYAYARPNKNYQNDFKFDTFGREIFIKKDLVTESEVDEWAQWKKKEGPRVGQNNKPALNLSKSQMHDYCAFKGAKVLNAFLYDAATFTPDDETKTRPGTVLRNTKVKQREWTTWMGLKISPYLEYLPKPLRPEQNLSPLSSLYPLNHPSQELGVRVSWREDLPLDANIDWSPFGPPEQREEKYQVGFRCYYEKGGER